MEAPHHPSLQFPVGANVKVSLSLALSLSHTHTHTQQCHFQRGSLSLAKTPSSLRSHDHDALRIPGATPHDVYLLRR